MVNNIYTVLKNIFRSSGKASIPLVNNTGQSIIIPSTPYSNINTNLIGETYKNPVAVACINYIINYIRKCKLITNIQEFFPYCSFNQILEQAVYQWLLYGNCFIEISRVSEGLYDLQVLHTSNVTVTHNNDCIQQIYYSYNGKRRKIPSLSHIIHLKNYNPLCHAYGKSILEVASSHIYQYNKINEYMLNIAGRGGSVSGIISTAGVLAQNERENLRIQIRNFVDQVNNNGSVMVLEGNFNWEQISISPQDLEMRKGLHQNAASIARALGIPPLLLGLDKKSINSSGAQYNEARKQLIYDTLYPLYSKILDYIVLQIKEKLGIIVNIQMELTEETS